MDYGSLLDELALTIEQMELLGEVDARRVIYTRGCYRHLAGKADVTDEIQRLRALGLVVLANVPPGQRIPPSRHCELTGKGIEVWHAHQQS